MSVSGTKVERSWPRKMAIVALFGLAFTTAPAQNSQNSQSSTPNQGSQPQAPAEAGGPSGDLGPMAVPKKKPEDEKPVERAPKVKNPEEIGTFSLKVNVPLVNLPVNVVTNNGQFIPGLKVDGKRIRTTSRSRRCC